MSGFGEMVVSVVAAPAMWYAGVMLSIFPRAIQPWPMAVPWTALFVVCVGLGWDSWRKRRYSRSVLFFGIALWQVVAPIMIGFAVVEK